MINEGEVKARNKALKKSWEAGEGSKAYINKKTDPNTGKPIDSSEKGEYHKAIMKHGTIPAWKRIGRTMRGNKKMDEQFIDRVINILIEQHKLRPDNFGGRGQSGGQLKDPASRLKAAKTLRLKRGLDKVGASKAPTKKEESTVLDRVIKILAEMKLGEAKYEKNMGRREKMEIRDKRFAADNPHPRYEPHENTFARRERKHVNTHGTWGHQHVKNRVKAREKAEEKAKAKREDSSTQLIKNKIAEGKRSKKLARAKNPDTIEKLKRSQETGNIRRALKAGKGGEDALNRMFGIGKRGS